MKNVGQTIKELTLMLLYLTSWQDQPARMRPDATGRVSWKSYDFSTLNKLEEEGHIFGSHKAKSVMLDESGVAQAKELLAKYGISESEGG